jgi:hypothetical protein
MSSGCFFWLRKSALGNPCVFVSHVCGSRRRRSRPLFPVMRCSSSLLVLGPARSEVLSVVRPGRNYGTRVRIADVGIVCSLERYVV